MATTNPGKRGRTPAGLILLAAGLLVACGAPAPSGAAVPAADASGRAAAPSAAQAAREEPALEVTVAIPSQSLSTFPLTLGQEAGIFREHGINLNVVGMASNAGIAAVIGGSAEYATPAGSVIRAINNGAPLKIVVTISDKSNHIMIVDPTVIREGKDLAGKAIAVNEIGGNEHLEAQAVLQYHGLDKNDATYVGITDNGQRLVALQAGAVQATITNVPFNFPAERMGFSVFANLAQLYELPTAVLATSEQYLAARPEAVQKMVRATLQALEYATTRKPEAVQGIARQFDLPEAQAAVAYDLVRDIWSTNGELSPGAYKNATDPLEPAGILPVAAVVDQRFLVAAR